MELEVHNIGGIISGQMEIERGLNVIRAQNFAGKSSLLRSVETIMGTSALDRKVHPLMESADDGSVKLKTGESTEYRVSLSKDGATVSSSGRPYIRNEKSRMLAHLFAFLGEKNPIRDAVESRDNERLTELLQRPLDMEDIDAEIREQTDKRDRIQKQIEQAKQQSQNLAALQSSVTQLEDELSDLRAKKDSIESQLEASEEVDEDLRDELSEARSKKSRLEATVDRLESEIDSLETKLAHKKKEKANVTIPEEPDVDDDVRAKRDKLEQIDVQINLLEDLYRANLSVLKEGEFDLITDVERSLSGDAIECWVCGESHPEDHFEQHVEELNDRRKQLEKQKVDVQTEIDQIQSQQEQYEAAVELDGQLQVEIEETELKLQEKQMELSNAEDDLAEVTATVESLRAERSDSDANELEAELSEVEREIGSTERELDQKRSALADAEEASERIDSLESTLAGVRGRLSQLRKKKTETQAELASEFSDTLADIIDRFGPGFDGGRLDVIRDSDDSLDRYELVVARDGREADLANLSESETTLVGFAVALAGYHTFDVGQRVSMMLVDSIGELSAESLHVILQYIRDECDPEYLISSAQPEAGNFDAHMIDPDLWTAVSDRGVDGAIAGD